MKGRYAFKISRTKIYNVEKFEKLISFLISGDEPENVIVHVFATITNGSPPLPRVASSLSFIFLKIFQETVFASNNVNGTLFTV